ncbi:hypothetical protein [Arsenicicoccus dermatophilus]|uniref:hypothetical protein n=1 Tax=Arsenicicoccus dermatophilus TaxID=1076331 RepID=UPI001F4C9B7D|nr:hypothetical protein [Arsenicicoccus dermatophilus]MCH8612656.1 hypothetical protein [Arsenicicoccus dermatophilus]
MATTDPDDIDARFAQIMAGWDEEADLPDRPGIDRRPGGDRHATDQDGAQPTGPAVTPPPTPAGPPPTPAPAAGPASRMSLPPAETTPPATAKPPAGPVPPGPDAPTAQQQRATDRWLVYRDGKGLSMASDHRTWSPDPDPDDETFTPPPPAPMPSLERDPAWWAIAVGLAVCPLLLVVMTLTGRTSPRILMWLLGLATVAAFVGLVVRLPRDRREDDPFDDGARL